MGTELRRLKPETITRALVALRAELIREGGPGADHVEALLQMRGHNLGPVPRKATVRFRRGRLRLAIYAALRDGPLPIRQIVERVCAAHRMAYGSLTAVACHAHLAQSPDGAAGLAMDKWTERGLIAMCIAHGVWAWWGTVAAVVWLAG